MYGLIYEGTNQPLQKHNYKNLVSRQSADTTHFKASRRDEEQLAAVESEHDNVQEGNPRDPRRWRTWLLVLDMAADLLGLPTRPSHNQASQKEKIHSKQ